jgi:hypothetical protein
MYWYMESKSLYKYSDERKLISAAMLFWRIESKLGAS